MTNQRKEENMLTRYSERQERLQKREMTQRGWREKMSWVEEPMDIGVMEDWHEMEIHEHKVMEQLMTNLGITEDMELGDVHGDEMLVDLAFDEEMENSFLDRFLEEVDGGSAAYMEDKLECENMTTFAVTEDTLASHADTEDILPVPAIMASGSVNINTAAYMNTGTWWLGNWISSSNNNTQVGIKLANCKSRLDCAVHAT